jgi:hypothetical protein
MGFAPCRVLAVQNPREHAYSNLLYSAEALLARLHPPWQKFTLFCTATVLIRVSERKPGSRTGEKLKLITSGQRKRNDNTESPRPKPERKQKAQLKWVGFSLQTSLLMPPAAFANSGFGV